MSKFYEDLQAIEVLASEEPLRQHFLTLHRLKMRTLYPDGSSSEPYFVETTLRRNLDAVAVVLFDRTGGALNVHLRRTLRPALAIREYVTGAQKTGILNMHDSPILLEVVAGLLESHDKGPEGVLQRALDEIWEEAGYKVDKKDLISLGAVILPTPGINPEHIHLFAAPVTPGTALPPPGDGSPLEEIGGMVVMNIDAAIAACVAGTIRDAKTEICLHRLKNRPALG